MPLIGRNGLSIGLGRTTLWIVSLAGGILLGVALHRTLPRRVPTNYSFTPAFAGCKLETATNRCACDGYLSPVGKHRDAAVRAGELLTDYSVSLCKLADAVADFTRAPVDGREQLRHATKPMFPAISGVNNAARALVLARVPLTIDVLSRQGHGSSDAERLACLLKSADKFQVEAFRNNLNTLMINIVLGWQGNADPSTYQNIQRQQASDWPRLALILRRGCEQYR
jgi:hypothetical protein